jgi:hypothetical protein
MVFYIDVELIAMRFSNTILFYKKIWSSVNIDTIPGGEQFEKTRIEKILILSRPIT